MCGNPYSVVRIVPGFVLGILAVMIWHGTCNYVPASQAGQGTAAMMASILVLVWAVAVLLLAGPARLVRGTTPSPPRRDREPTRA